jgi:hypothetical protein
MMALAHPVFDPPPRTEACRFVLGYWASLRGGRLRPRRAEIDPGALARHLPNVGMFEVRSTELTYCRLAGSAFRLSLGFELTGRNVVHLYAPELHRAAGFRFQSIATRPCAAAVVLELKFSSGLENPHEVLLLPLEADDPQAPPMILVGMSAIEAVAWQNTAVLPQLRPSSTFRFVDIGAGIPEATMPPDGWNGT